jgi:hypothetical protein
MQRVDTQRLRIVVCGYIGLFPAGGAVWDYIQYPLGLRRLGHDVYYIEDTGNWPEYVPEGVAADGRYNIAHLERVMNEFGLGDRWAYLDPVSGNWFGMPTAKVDQVRRNADLLVSISCSAAMGADWSSIPVRAVIDSDPMFTQIQAQGGSGFTQGSGGLGESLRRYTHHFTFGECVGLPRCQIPDDGFDWQATRQPIVLDHWDSDPASESNPFSTVMNWTAGAPLLWDGREWGQKDREFPLVESLPARFPANRFRLAVNAGPEFPRERIEASGWQVVEPDEIVPDWRSYRDFLRASAGEVSVAKHAYVQGGTGWFSCRTACYLAAGRPALVQDTGWSRVIPSGQGVLGFSSAAEAEENMKALIKDYGTHARRAREIAQQEFDSDRVLGSLLERCGTRP